MPKPKFELVPGTDAFYRITVDGNFLGQVRKVYTGRSTHLWTVAPVNYQERTTQRVCYNTRNEARQALIGWHQTGRRSLVEG